MELPQGRPAVMGILNVTPDSFSDGGRFADVRMAVDAALKMVEDGADLIDVGGESTRPGSEPVPAEEELRRTIPVVRALAEAGVVVSVDTMKPAVAREALRAGARVINDVTALEEPEMRDVCAESGCTVCLMHMQGRPQTMQTDPRYVDVVREVRDFLLGAASEAEAAGVRRDRIWIDPGIGFGKTQAHNLSLLKHLDVLVQTGFPVLIGVSRKGFIGRIGGKSGQPLPIEERMPGTLAAQVLAQASGAKIVRAHDVREARRAIDLAASILAAS